jgi:uncharacterized lipoprotein YmbA
MRQGFSPAKMLFAGVVAAVVGGCGTSPPARLYTLTPIPQQEMKAVERQGAHLVSVSVAPVDIPDYLDRSPIVTRDGTTGLKLAEFHRWGGSLGDNITTVLVENLSALLSSDRVVAYPGMRYGTPDFRTEVRVLRLDCIPEDRVELKAQWLVVTGEERQEVARGLSTFTERVAGGSYESLVAAVSGAVGQLSREIAQGMTVAKDALSTSPAQVRPKE